MDILMRNINLWIFKTYITTSALHQEEILAEMELSGDIISVSVLWFLLIHNSF